jgi:hypothetical protein
LRRGVALPTEKAQELTVEQFNYLKLNHEAGLVRLLMDVDGVESEAPSDFLEDLIALGSRGLEAEALGWRQIETAPKDGIRIFGLLDRGTGATPRYETKVICRHDPGGIHEAWATDCGTPVGSMPKYWQPLPAPQPKEGGALVPSVPASENSQLQRLVAFLEGAERLTGMPTLLTVRDKLLSLSFALREKERQSSACRKD